MDGSPDTGRHVHVEPTHSTQIDLKQAAGNLFSNGTRVLETAIEGSPVDTVLFNYSTY